MEEDKAKQRYERWRQRFSAHLPVLLILILSLTLNLWGNRWGAPDFWHPDELTRRAMDMVYRRSLNPKFFAYGGLHYYVLSAGAVIPVLAHSLAFDPPPADLGTASGKQWIQRQKARIIPLARAISALMAMLLVLLTYLMGKLLFGRGAGVLGALFLCVSPYFVEIAHFATVDTPANFWYWLSCLFALMAWKREKGIWFILASLTAGFAIGTKLDRVVVLIPLVLAHLLRGKGLQARRLLRLPLFAILGYVLANPTIFFSFFEFVDGTSRELFYNMLRGEPEVMSYLRLLALIKSGLGLPLFLAVLVGLGYAGWDFVLKRKRAEIGWLVAVIVPFYVLYGPRLAITWYVPVFFPGLALFAAYGCLNIYHSLAPRYVVAMRMGIAGIVFLTILYSICFVLQFSHDSRYQAAKWIDRHMPANTTIEVGPRGPAVSQSKYRLTQRPLHLAFDGYDFARRIRDKLERHQLYRMIHRGIFALERLKARTLGRPARQQPYMAWFDSALASSDSARTESPTVGVSGSGNPDYVVLIGYLERSRISALQSPDSGYRSAAQFHYRNPFGIEVSFPFVNPEVYIFQRDETSK